MVLDSENEDKAGIKELWEGDMAMGLTKITKKASAYAYPGQRTKTRVLVVDDNGNIQDILSMILSSMGFEVALAKNGLQAFALFLRDSFDVILTDLEMPVMDGAMLARLIKERSPGTPIILLTGTDMETVKEKVERGTVNSVISKPFNLDHFQRTVQDALELKEADQGVMRAL
jgi:CheY-like chemotaxis protein